MIKNTLLTVIYVFPINQISQIFLSVMLMILANSILASNNQIQQEKNY